MIRQSDWFSEARDPRVDLLDTIVAATRIAIAERQARIPERVLEREALDRAPNGRRFEAAIAKPGKLNVIAECKRRSPLKGVLRKDYDVSVLAKDYERAGAAAISVLTESAFFDGCLDHLRLVREAVALPLLRKDFVVSEYQLLEARAAGADAALLIVAALDPQTLAQLIATANDAALAVLVEVHNEGELETAVDAGARIIGVNNRNLRTLEVVIETSERLIGKIPKDVIAITESGLQTQHDLLKLSTAGYHGFLIGETLVASLSPGDTLEAMLAY
ncbi:MAG TPA: indole-3-glycerol phosphate synthase TrpC [Acidobacteria bacterium]|nr:indole-3-glycerol phosphate synthase TrpC [Acidobacteriota bacterium]